MADEPRTKWGWMMAGIGGLLVVMGAVGLGLPQIATKDEVKEQFEQLAGDLKVIKRDVWNQQIESYEVRRLRLQRDIEERERKGLPPGAAADEVRILKRRTRSLQLKIDKLDKDE